MDLVAATPPDWREGLILAVAALALAGGPVALLGGSLAFATWRRRPRHWSAGMRSVAQVARP